MRTISTNAFSFVPSLQIYFPKKKQELDLANLISLFCIIYLSLNTILVSLLFFFPYSIVLICLKVDKIITHCIYNYSLVVILFDL